MKKDFDAWNELKKSIQQNTQEIYFNEAEVWWCTLGINVGHEQDGVGNLAQRPVLVLKKLSAETCVVVPLTSSHKIHPPPHIRRNNERTKIIRNPLSTSSR